MFALTSLVICRIAKNFERKLHTVIRPRNVFTVAFTGVKSRLAVMLHLWKENPVTSDVSFSDCAVMTLLCPTSGLRASIWKFWNTAVASPQMKSTVPVIWHSM